MKLLIDTVLPVRIRELKHNALCLSYDSRGLPLYVAKVADRSIGVFLSGRYAFSAFEIDITTDWKGLALLAPAIVVESDSAYDTEADWAPIGSLMLDQSGARLQVSMKDHHGFSEKVGLNLGLEVTSISAGLGVGFTKWSFKIGEGDEAQYFPIEARTDAPTDL